MPLMSRIGPGCAMGSPLSVILADIHMVVRAENEVVKPMNPPFYKRLLTTYTAEQYLSTRCLI